ncbi:MAG TPA: hypothetical protein VGM73_10885 [Candidatus Didemnitutus sp.]|jgi:Na+-driven multidrug efflux pump
MKGRNPLLGWLLIMATLGQYAFVWVFFLARDVNHAADEERVHVSKHACIFGCMWIIYAICMIAAARSPIEALAYAPAYVFPLVMLLTVSLLSYFFWLILAVAKEMRRTGITRVPSNGALIGYSLLYMTSLPLLQRRVNGELNKAAQARSLTRPV